MAAKRQPSDLLVALLFFLAGILLRLPFRSQFLYHWDSVNFALGLNQFDVARHQPQPPGYILYILLGRLFKLIFQEDNASLVAISILFSGLTAAMLYLAAKGMFNRRVGVTAGLLGLTSPLMWFYSEVALSYMVEAFFVTAIAYSCYRQLNGDRRFVIPAALLLALAGGFRQNTLVLMAPVWLFSLKGVRWPQRGIGLAAAGLVTAAWLAVMVWMSGGLQAYLAAVTSQTGGNLADSAAGSVETLAMNAARLGLFSFYGLLLAGLALPVFLVWLLRHFKTVIRLPEWQVLFLWTAPATAFYALYVQQAGHTFTYLPGLFIILAYTLMEIIAPALSRWKSVTGLGWTAAGYGLVGIIAAANAGFFLFAEPYLFGMEKFILRTPSRQAIFEHDQDLAGKLGYIRSQFPPQQTLVLAGGMDYRIPDYYLADYARPEAAQADHKLEYLVLFNEEAPLGIPETIEVESHALPVGDPVGWIEISQAEQLLFTDEGVEIDLVGEK